MNQNLSYFVDKICTIFVGPINRNFDEDQNLAYFIGKVLSISDSGVFIEHPSTKCKTFFNMRNITGIAEEKLMIGKPPENNKNS
jgi:hypothetical protein